MSDAIRLLVTSQAQAAGLWRALSHIPLELLQPMECHLEGHGYLWTFNSGDDPLPAPPAAPQARTPRPAASE